MSGAKVHSTSVRLDEFQRTALQRLASEEDRSTSWLIQKAIDAFVEDRLNVSRRSFERTLRRKVGEQALANWRPAPWRVPTDEELTGGGVGPTVPG